MISYSTSVLARAEAGSLFRLKPARAEDELFASCHYENNATMTQYDA